MRNESGRSQETILRRWAFLLPVLGAALLASTSAAAGERAIAFVGCRIVTAPDAPAIEDGVLVMAGTRIQAVGQSDRVRVPGGAERIACAGGTLVPGFWNSHVHFMGPVWQGADRLPAARLTAQLGEMLTSRGFVHVVDTGSDLANTLALRRRIASGEVRGPAIVTAGSVFVGANGTPFYITDAKLPELHSPDQARRIVAESIRSGAGAVKLMSVSLTREQPFPFISEAVIRAASDEAHRAGVKLLVHPTDRRGVELAISGGADVLLHTAPIGGPWDPALAERIAASGLALVPTLKLWGYEAAKAKDAGMARHFGQVSRQQVAAFRTAGGRILFGTDVGYMSDFDPSEEYAQLAEAGMSARDILASLTTNPVRTFGSPKRQGRLAAGHDADLVLLNGDIDKDVKALATARLAYRAGRLVYNGAAQTETEAARD